MDGQTEQVEERFDRCAALMPAAGEQFGEERLSGIVGGWASEVVQHMERIEKARSPHRADHAQYPLVEFPAQHSHGAPPALSMVSWRAVHGAATLNMQTGGQWHLRP